LRNVAEKIPLQRLLAETDSPYLAPQAVRGKRNEPANVMHTLEVLAEARDEKPEVLARVIDENATAAFGLP
jgi:TatD DNase family protein